MTPLPKSLLNEKHSDRVTYLLIAVTLILFNLIAIFGSKVLLHDEPGFYSMVINHQFPSTWTQYNLIGPYTEWLAWNILAYSPPLARSVYVLFLLVPLSCCFYYLCRAIFQFPRLTAFAAATLPQILPMQWQIPAGINMSYVVWGLLFTMLSLILGFLYLEKDTPKNWVPFLAATLCFFIATQIMELALFILPPILLAFWGYRKFQRKHVYLILVFTLVGLAKYIQMTMYPRKIMRIMPFDVIFQRIGLYFTWALPVPALPPLFATLIYFSIVFIAFLLYFKHPPQQSGPLFCRFSMKGRHLFVYGFFLSWMITTILPIIILSIPYPPRYAYISMFGAQALFVYAIYLILKKVFPLKRQLKIAIFIIIILLAGVSRTIYLKNYYAIENRIAAIMVRDLNEIQLPWHAQIVIVNLEGFYGGWPRSSGYFQFLLKRNDLSGLIGKVNSNEYYNFDNHFDPLFRKWSSRYNMTGLSLDQPLFLFYFDKKNKKLKPMEYALQWRGEKKDAPWTILRVDKVDGQLYAFAWGVGMDEYLSTIRQLQKKGISQSDILWGGPPTPEQQKRLQY